MGRKRKSAPQKDQTTPGPSNQGDDSQKRAEMLNEQLKQIKSFDTKDEVDLKVAQVVLLDVTEASKQLAELKQLLPTPPTNNNDMVSIAEKADCVEKKLNKVHNYMKHILDSNWDVVLHKAQFGQKPFPMETLPGPALKRIFHYLDFEDLMKVREVSKRLAELVVLLRPDMRCWNCDMDNVTFFANLRAKGIHQLKHFQLNLSLFPYKITRLLTAWKNHIFGLTVFLADALEIEQDGNYLFPNLERLTIAVGNTFARSGEIITNILTTHSRTLKRLDIFATGNFKFQGGLELPNLNALAVQGNPSALQPMLKNFGQNLAVLNLSGADFDIEDMDEADLRMPCLKQLGIGSIDGLKLVTTNAAQIEVLAIVANECTWEVDEERESYPDAMPNLHMLICDFEYTEVVQIFLEASSKSLKHLVLNCPLGYYPYEAFKMEKLTNVVINYMSEFTEEIIAKNADNIEFMAIGVEGKPDETLDLECDLLKLKKVVLTHDYKAQMSETPVIKDMKQKYPHAKILAEKTESFAHYANAFMKKHGVDKMLELATGK